MDLREVIFRINFINLVITDLRLCIKVVVDLPLAQILAHRKFFVLLSVANEDLFFSRGNRQIRSYEDLDAPNEIWFQSVKYFEKNGNHSSHVFSLFAWLFSFVCSMLYEYSTNSLFFCLVIVWNISLKIVLHFDAGVDVGFIVITIEYHINQWSIVYVSMCIMHSTTESVIQTFLVD